jgi:hypothetical protein
VNRAVAVPVFFLMAKYRQMAKKIPKMLILAIFFQKHIFLSPNFSSNMIIFHPLEQIFIKLE